MGAESHQDPLRALGAALALLAFAVLAACGAGSGPQPAGGPGARDGADAQTTSGASGVFFPQVREGLDGGPDALTGGGSSWTRRGASASSRIGAPPRFPCGRRTCDWRPRTEGYASETAGADRGGGRQGGLHGRGQIGLPKDVVSPRTARELRDRCLGELGDYWIGVNSSLDPVTPVGSISPDG